MESDLEETEFDAIVLGTGLSESVIAGALARAGQKVLHIDHNDYYGGHWRVFSFKEMLCWVKQHEKQVENPTTNIDYKAYSDMNFRNARIEWYQGCLSNDEDNQVETELTLEEAIDALSARLTIPISEDEASLVDDAIREEACKLLLAGASTSLNASVGSLSTMIEALRHSKQYNLDLAPKILAAGGPFVDTLVRSGVGSYLEFYGVNNVLIFDSTTNALEKVPSSKEDVFSTKSIPLIDKRKLMKYLTFAYEMNFEKKPDLLKDCASMTYATFLEEKFKITGKLQSAILHAISFVENDQESPENGLRKTQAFLKSMGRFSKGAHLCCLYGAGSEISQAFCRVCAVYGGIYILGQHVESFIMDDDTGLCTGIVTKEKKRYQGKRIVASIDYLDRRWYPADTNFGSWISRAILVTKCPLFFSGDSEASSDAPLSYSVIPPHSVENDVPILMLHFDQSSMACPAGQYVTYAWMNSDNQTCLEKAVGLLLKDKECTQPLFAIYFQQFTRQAAQGRWRLPNNVIPCGDPGPSLDVDDAMREAMATFEQCLPGADFLPAEDRKDDP